MANTTRIVILGCGASAGVPRPNLDWGDCDASEPKNRRTRASLLIQHKGFNIVIDTGADFRQQMIAAKLTKLDAVLYTHMHADHTNGIDDLRSYVLSQNKCMPVYSEKTTLQYLQQTFAYCFKTPLGSNYPPILEAQEITPDCKFNIGSLEILPFLQQHGDIHSLGFRFLDIAYCTDISSFDDNLITKLRGIKYLILGALQYKHHKSHLTVAQALNLIKAVKPKKAYLTHMHNKLDYKALKRILPSEVEPAYDGLSFMV